MFAGYDILPAFPLVLSCDSKLIHSYVQDFRFPFESLQADLGHRLFAMNRTREQILQAPAAPAPPGIIPNFENPLNTASYMIPVFAAVVIFTNLVFLVKMWV